MALYEEIRDDLLSKIKDGTYREGQRIPTEKELACAYGVSRPTVRQALQILEKDGYLDRRRRRGTVVCRPKVRQHFTAGLRSFAEDIHLEGRSTRTEVLAFEELAADDEAAGALSLDAGAPVWHLVRLRYVDEAPNVVVDTYVPRILAPGIGSCDFARDSLYRELDACGQTVMSAHRSFEAIAADGEIARLLGVEPGAPMLFFHTIGRTAAGTAIEYSKAVYRGDGNIFELDVSRK